MQKKKSLQSQLQEPLLGSFLLCPSNQGVDALPLLHRNSTVAHVSRSGAGPGYPHL